MILRLIQEKIVQPQMRKFLLLFLALAGCIPEPSRIPGDPLDSPLLDYLLFRSTRTASCADRGFCYIYSSQNPPATGSYGGIAGADAMCSQDAARPAAATYTIKAFLVGTTRRASLTASAGDGQLDWVLRSNQQYRRSDGTTVIGTTGSNALFTFPLAASFGTVGIGFRTGLNVNWTTVGNDCLSWTDGSVGQTSEIGTANQTNNTAIGGGNITCSNPGYYLMCVEQ